MTLCLSGYVGPYLTLLVLYRALLITMLFTLFTMSLIAEATYLNNNRARWTFVQLADGTFKGTRLGLYGGTYKTFSDVQSLDSYLSWCTTQGWSVRRSGQLQRLLSV